MKYHIVEKAHEVRGWMLTQISADKWALPHEDEVWSFITTRWPRLDTDACEKILGEAFKPIN